MRSTFSYFVLFHTNFLVQIVVFLVQSEATRLFSDIWDRFWPSIVDWRDVNSWRNDPLCHSALRVTREHLTCEEGTISHITLPSRRKRNLILLHFWSLWLVEKLSDFANRPVSAGGFVVRLKQRVGRDTRDVCLSPDLALLQLDCEVKNKWPLELTSQKQKRTTN